MATHLLTLECNVFLNVLNEAELFRRLIDDMSWISASKLLNGRIRQALASAFANSSLELTLRQACAAEQTNEVEYLDVNQGINTADDFGFVTKDFAKPTAEGSSLMGNHTSEKQHSRKWYLEKQ